jgi:hypothetical protein
MHLISVSVFFAVLGDMTFWVFYAILETVVRFGDIVNSVTFAVLVGNMNFMFRSADWAAEFGI